MDYVLVTTVCLKRAVNFILQAINENEVASET